MGEAEDGGLLIHLMIPRVSQYSKVSVDPTYGQQADTQRYVRFCRSRVYFTRANSILLSGKPLSVRTLGWITLWRHL